jgi:hypothetical protein
MGAIATDAQTICRAAGATARRRFWQRRQGFHRAHAVLLRFLDALVPPCRSPVAAKDEADWPRYPPF